jgi:hypothetical protein
MAISLLHLSYDLAGEQLRRRSGRDTSSANEL